MTHGTTGQSQAGKAWAEELGPGFSVFEQGRFRIHSDAEPWRVRWLSDEARSVERAVVAFSDRLRLCKEWRDGPMVVIFFGAWEPYEAFSRQAGFVVQPESPGFYDQLGKRSVLFDYTHAPLMVAKRRELTAARKALVDRPDEGRDGQGGRWAALRQIEEAEAQLAANEKLVNQTVIRHELAHQVLSHMGIQPVGVSGRRWLWEGLAMQFEDADGLNRHRLMDFKAAASSARRVRLRSLISDPAVMGAGARDASTAYASAWALVYYLIQEKREALAAYLQQAECRDELTAFDQAFGPPEGAFEDSWRRYVQDLSGGGRGTAPPAGDDE